MSDLKRFVELYKTFGIDCKVIVENESKTIILREHPYVEDSTISEKLIGYGGFFSVLQFDKDGKFLNQGFYE